MVKIFDELQLILNRAVTSGSAKAHGLLHRLGQMALGTVLLFSMLVLATIGLLTVVAAAVVALAPRLGVAIALMLIGGVLLVIGAAAAALIWHRLSTPALESITPSSTDDSAHLAPDAQNLFASQADPHLARTQLPHPAPPSAVFENLPKVDPLFVAASFAAAAALLGPSRLLRLFGTVTAGIGVAKSLAPLADVLHKYNDIHSVSDMFRQPPSRSSKPPL